MNGFMQSKKILSMIMAVAVMGAATASYASAADPQPSQSIKITQGSLAENPTIKSSDGEKDVLNDAATGKVEFTIGASSAVVTVENFASGDFKPSGNNFTATKDVTVGELTFAPTHNTLTLTATSPEGLKNNDASLESSVDMEFENGGAVTAAGNIGLTCTLSDLNSGADAGTYSGEYTVDGSFSYVAQEAETGGGEAG